MIERKTIIKEIQKILNDHYNHYVFGKASQELNDEEIDFFINCFDDLQRDFDELYKKYGYTFTDDYETPIETENTEGGGQ